MGIVQHATAPSGLVVTLDEVRHWCAIDLTGDAPADAATDAWLTGRINGFTALAEAELGRPLLTRNYTLALDAWPKNSEISLVLGGVTAIVGITYQDPAGTGSSPLVLNAAAYELDNRTEPPAVWLKRYQVWPTALNTRNTIIVTFTAGWGTAAAVPDSIKSWIVAHVADLYKNREATTDKTMTSLPYLSNLLDPYRVLSFA